MTVNVTTHSSTVVFLVALMLTMGCSETIEAPRPTWLVASSTLDTKGESRRVDVAVDLHNENGVALKDVELTITFTDHTEAKFSFDEIATYAIRGSQTAVELKHPVKDGSMLGGSNESLVSERSGVVTLYATDVEAATIKFTPDGASPREVDCTKEAAQALNESFQRLFKSQSDREERRKKRLEHLKTLVEQSK